MPEQPKWMTITGWVLTALLILPFGVGGMFKISQHPDVVKGFKDMGFPDGSALTIGIVEVACLLVYLFPRTAVLGAVLLTGYMGGAICVHVQRSESIIFHIVIGVIIWLGIYLREPRLRLLLPLR